MAELRDAAPTVAAATPSRPTTRGTRDKAEPLYKTKFVAYISENVHGNVLGMATNKDL